MSLDRWMEHDRTKPHIEHWKRVGDVWVTRLPSGAFKSWEPVYHEYTKWFYYPKSSENRQLDIEVRLVTRKKLTLAEAERIIDDALRNDYNMDSVTWHRSKMGHERLAKRPKAMKKRERFHITVFDKTRRRVMRPWKEYLGK